MVQFSLHVSGLRDKHADMRKYWTQFWHTRYGNCYSFNKGMDKNGTYTPLMTSAQTGIGQYRSIPHLLALDAYIELCLI